MGVEESTIKISFQNNIFMENQDYCGGLLIHSLKTSKYFLVFGKKPALPKCFYLYCLISYISFSVQINTIGGKLRTELISSIITISVNEPALS